MRKLITVLFIAIMGLTLVGCNEAEKVSGEDFVTMMARNPESMRHTEFVGVKDGMAVMKVSKMSPLNQKKWNDSYFVTEVGHLPEGWIDKNKPGAVK